MSHNISTTASLRVDSTNTGTLKKGGTTQFMPGMPIVSVIFAHPMLFEVFSPVNKDGNETLSTNSVMKLYQKLANTILVSHGQALIWKARDDERCMHVLRFQKEDVKKTADSVLRASFVFRWVVGRCNYYIDGPDDSFPVEDGKLGEMVVRTVVIKE
jgi:hypothetical protein